MNRSGGEVDDLLLYDLVCQKLVQMTDQIKAVRRRSREDAVSRAAIEAVRHGSLRVIQAIELHCHCSWGDVGDNEHSGELPLMYSELVGLLKQIATSDQPRDLPETLRLLVAANTTMLSLNRAREKRSVRGRLKQFLRSRRRS